MTVAAEGRDSQGRAAPGNQIARKYPKAATDDPAVQEQLAHRRDQIISDKGGADRLSAMQVADIGRYVVLEAFVTSWESYFMKSSPISRQGRVRSGYREGYLSSLAMLAKLGQQIGVTRVAHDIADMDLQTWLQSEGGNAHGDAPGSSQEAEQTCADSAETDPASLAASDRRPDAPAGADRNRDPEAAGSGLGGRR